MHNRMQSYNIFLNYANNEKAKKYFMKNNIKSNF